MKREIQLVLASASPRREALLKQIGFSPVVMPSRIEEKVNSERPEEVVMELSLKKAKEVAARLGAGGGHAPTGEDGNGIKPGGDGAARDGAAGDGAARDGAARGGAGQTARPHLSTVILGSDTVVSVAGQILGKPRDEEEAYRMLSLLAGRSHEVFTGVTLVSGERKRTFYEKTEVSVYPMEPGEIRAYLACGESMDKAGAYGIQGRFAAHIKRIDGSYTNVMGLPVGRVYQELKQLTEEQDD